MVRLLAVSFLFLAFSAQAQSPRWWGSLNAGRSFNSRQYSGSVAFGFQPARSRWLVSGRYLSSVDLFSGATEPQARAGEVASLVGYEALPRVQVSTGLGFTWGVKKGAFLRTEPDTFYHGGRQLYEPVLFSEVSLPVEVRWLLTDKTGGIGLTGYGNFSRSQSQVGLAVSFYMGRFR